MLLFFQTDSWSWSPLAVISSAIAGVILLGTFVKALHELRTLGWDKFKARWITPRKTRRDADAARIARQEDLFGKVAGVASTCEELGAKVTEILREVKPNGGGSLNDRVAGIDNKLDDVIAERQHQNETSEEAIFKLDAFGEMVYTNCAFRELVNAEDEQLSHNNYLSLMDDDDRRRFIRTRDEAIKYMMPLDSIVKFKIPGTPRFVNVRLQASPDVRVVKLDAVLKGFFGTAGEVKDV
jgi:hypothetical protein